MYVRSYLVRKNMLKMNIIIMILFLPFLIGCYGLSIRSIIIKNIKFTPKPPPHDQPAKLARYVMHYSGDFINLNLDYVKLIKNYLPAF